MCNEDPIRDFLEEYGIARDANFSPLSGGRNNRIFKIADEFVLKQYFSHVRDNRNRLEHEYKFLRFSWENGVKCVPEPLASDFELNIGLYAFVRGRKLDDIEIPLSYIQQAVEFVKKVNLSKRVAAAQEIPAAADSAFCLNGHIGNIQKRIDLFQKFKHGGLVESVAFEFISDSLVPEWVKRKRAFEENSRDLNIDTELKLGPFEKCLSPSDFGFHNALIKEDDSVIFLDFEYAGWDDPVKMICDFFCQPEVPVSLDFFDGFVDEISALFSEKSGSLKDKTKLFLPLNRLKWCCILLNDFLHVGNERRSFSEQDSDSEQRKAKQLEKAVEYFNKSREEV